MELEHVSIISQILKKEMGESESKIERLTTGLCNEVYSVLLSSRSVIVRLNADPSKLKGSEKYIPLFKSLDIKVPDIVASDYSRTFVPFAYQILSKIEGQDLGKVIEKLTDEQLDNIAKEVVAIFRKLEVLPTNGKYGWDNGGGGNFFSSWTVLVEDMIQRVKMRNEKTGIVGDTYIKTMEELLYKHQGYFSTVKSVFFFDDLSTKNIMIDAGKFSGIVDLDTMEYGDPLEAVGRIMAGWIGTRYGDFYANAVMDGLGLNQEQKKIVRVYATLNRIEWLSENGIQFNQNTSTQISKQTLLKDREAVELLIRDL